MQCRVASVWRLLFGLVVLAGGFPTCEAWAKEPLRLRVMSYNIHHAEGVDGKLDVARIARVIRDEKPDLVSLQEVDRRVKRTQGVDQAAELGKLTGMHVAFGANIELQGGQYGNAILSRWPIRSSENRRLPNVDRGEQRGLLMAEIALPGDAGKIVFAATHFDHRPDDAERFQSTAAVERLIGEFEKEDSPRAVILAGDLNDVPESRTLKALREHWSVANKEPMATIPVDRPTSQIDFILSRPRGKALTAAFRVLDEAVASDHRAIVADLDL